MSSASTVTALVLAGSRRGESDPVARYRQVAAKCLATAGGVPLLVRVLRALTASPCIDRVLVSLDDPALRDRLPELALPPLADRLTILASAQSLSRSVAEAFERAQAPMLVTTADHALLDPDMVAHFIAGAERTGADVAFGVAAAATIQAGYPDTRRTYLRFRDGGYSGANLFLLRTAAAARAIEFWRRIERDRKAPWRLARAFGPVLLAAYLLRVATLAQAPALVSRRLGIRVAAIVMPTAEAAIDVDRPADLDLVESILARRDGRGAKA